MTKFIFTILIWLQFTLNIYSQETIYSYWNKSIEYSRNKDYMTALEYINKYIAKAPYYYYAYYNRGVDKEFSGDFMGACRDFQRPGFEFVKKSYQRSINYLCNDSMKIELIKKFYKDKDITYNPEDNYKPFYHRTDTLRGALRFERNCFDVTYYNLTLKLIMNKKSIEGNNKIYFKVIQSTKRIQLDLFENLQIHNIVWNGDTLNYTREYNAVFIDFPEDLPINSQQIISIDYSGKPREAPDPPWIGGFVWKKDRYLKPWISVACEQYGASSWWPNKDHLSDEPDSMLVNLIVPKGLKGISNGNLRSEKVIEGKFKQYTWFISYPINNYNVTFYVGNFKYFNDTIIKDEKPYLLEYYVLPYHLKKAKEHFIQAKEIVLFYEKVFGDYPFWKDGYGLVESSYPGMEHQSAIAIGGNYGKEKIKAYRNTKYDYLIVHETAHEWWGNSVSCGDMADAWIHEGFATYAEFLFIEEEFGKEEYLYELTDNFTYVLNLWPLIGNKDVNDNTFLSGDIYTKGAITLHCLRATINNDTLFFKIIKDFCVKNRYGIVNSQDFISFVNEYTSDDYTPFFNKFLKRDELPVLTYSYNKVDGNIIFNYGWAGVDENFKMPFGIRTDSEKCIRIEATTELQTIHLKNTKTFNFIINPNEDFSQVDKNAVTYYWTFNTNQ